MRDRKRAHAIRDTRGPPERAVDRIRSRENSAAGEKSDQKTCQSRREGTNFGGSAKGMRVARTLPVRPTANREREGLMPEWLAWIIVGLVAGLLASFVMGGVGFGIIGDIVIGILGAFVGAWIFNALDIGSPAGGLLGTIIVAFVGAVVLLFILRLLRRTAT
jgi:uncharacterized membrane protein YeaQ/YmgE (transglycosylase-associated protein family)